jgi:hypothetical protein
MIQSLCVGEVLVIYDFLSVMGSGSAMTPKRSTRSVRPSAKTRASVRFEASPPTRVRQTARTIPGRPIDVEVEEADNTAQTRSGSETGKALLLRVLGELEELKDASSNQ